MKKRKIGSKKTRKRNSGLIIGFLNFINDWIMSALSGGFFAKLLSGSANTETLINDSFFLGKGATGPEGKEKSLKRYLLRMHDKSVLLGFFRRCINKFLVCKINVLGVFLLPFGVYSLVVYLIKYYYANGILDKYIFSGGAFIGSIMIIVLAVPFFMSQKSISSLLSESVLARGVFEDGLGISEEKFVPMENDARFGPYFIAIIFGIILGGLSYFVSPTVILIAIAAIVIITIVLHFPEAGVIVSIFLAPLVGFFEHPTIVMAAIVLVTLSSYLIKLIIGKRSLKFKLTDVMVAIFTALMLFGGIITAGGKESLKSALIYVIFLAVYFLVVNLMNTREWLEKCVDAIALPSAIVALFGILSYTNVTMPGGWIDSSMFSDISNRAISTFSNPNMLATYLIMTAPFLWMNISDRNTSHSGKIFSFIGSILSFVCVVLTWSRGGWIGYLAAVLVYCLINYRYTIKYLIVLGVAAPIGYVVMPQSIISRFLSIGNLTDSSTYYRLFTWKGSFKMFFDHMIGGIGVGPSAFNRIYPIYSYVGVEVTSHSHNLFLQIAIELGVVGLIVFLVILFGIARNGFGSLKRVTNDNSRLAISAGMAGIVAAISHGMVDYVWFNYRVFFMFWVIVALICAYTRVESSIAEYRSTYSDDTYGNEATLNIIFREN